MAEAIASDITKTVKDAAYVAVGFGVIAFQKAQVRRRELEQQLEVQLDQLEERLPDPAADALKQARAAVAEAQSQLKTLWGAGNSTQAAA